jgi:hypothetical protein
MTELMDATTPHPPTGVGGCGGGSLNFVGPAGAKVTPTGSIAGERRYFFSFFSFCSA